MSVRTGRPGPGTPTRNTLTIGGTVITLSMIQPHQDTSDPTVNDDSDDGYVIGSRWINTSSDEEFVATDVTAGAAVWLSTTAIPTIDLDDLGDVNAPSPSDGDLLAYDSGSSMWVPVTPAVIPSGTAVGDLLVWDGDSWEPLAKGSNGQVLTVDTAETLDLKWATPSGGSGATIKRAPLTPGTFHATYGDDFDQASLDAKWTAFSVSGSFATTHVQTQEENGSWLSMMFSAQNGHIWEPTTNVDQEVTCCMKTEWRIGTAAGGANALGKVGIAILDSSGNGVGAICYNDSTAYMMEITAGVLGANQAFGSGFGGSNRIGNSPIWLRLTRVGDDFQSYISFSGRAWTENSATPTRTKAITASRIAIGAFNDGGNLLTGRLLYDWVDRTA